MIFFFLLLLSSIDANASFDDLSLKRSWSRKLIKESQLQDPAVFQNFKPHLLEDGRVLQGSSHGGLYLIDTFGRKKELFNSEHGLSGAFSIKSNFVFLGLQNKSLIALNLENKKVLWRVKLDTAPTSISDISDGLLFAQTESGAMYALKASDGTVEWKTFFKTTKELSVFGDPKPIIFGTQVIAGFSNGSLVSFNQKTGKPLWQKLLPGGKKFSDIQYLKLSPSNSSLFAGVFDEALYKINIITGQVEWQAFDKPVSDISFDSSSLYFSSSNGELIKLKQTTGTQIKKVKAFKGVGGTPLVLDDSLIVVDSKGPVYKIHKETFKVKSLYEFLHNISAPMTLNSSKNEIFLFSDKSYLFKMAAVKQ